MLVRFLSSETGEILMFAEAARPLLQAIGKETTARGTFTQAEMADAARRLSEAVKNADTPHRKTMRWMKKPGKRKSRLSRSVSVPGH